MDITQEPATESIIIDEEKDEVVNALQYHGWYVICVVLLACHLWKRVIYPFVLRNREIKREKERKSEKAKKETPVDLNKEEARLAAIERLQKTYNEDIMRMKKTVEEREERRRKKYLADLAALNPGRKLNE